MKDVHALSYGDVSVYIDQSDTVLQSILERIAQSGSVHLICDENTFAHCLPRIPQLAAIAKDPIIIHSGEEHKTLNTCEKVWRALMSQHADRTSVVINLGGGVVTDLGGFCAATYMRGISFMHIPTTLLGMCDAAIGGKHGVDFEGLKNYIGVIQQPASVWVDTRFLATLPERHVHNGMAEMVKYALIGDPDLFQLLERADVHKPVNWQDLLIHTIGVKMRFIVGDIQEQGIRAALNFGHTFGHALESYFLNTTTPLLHGECIAQGMILETWLSHFHLGFPDRETCRQITALIQEWTPVNVPRKIRFNDLMPFLAMDKKQRSGIPRYSLIRDIGQVEIGQVVNPAVMEQLITDAEVKQLVPWLGS